MLFSQLGQSKGITVNAVGPGPALTDIYPEGTAYELMATEIALTKADNRAGTPADIGDAVLFVGQREVQEDHGSVHWCQWRSYELLEATSVVESEPAM